MSASLVSPGPDRSRVPQPYITVSSSRPFHQPSDRARRHERRPHWLPVHRLRDERQFAVMPAVTPVAEHHQILRLLEALPVIRAVMLSFAKTEAALLSVTNANVSEVDSPR